MTNATYLENGDRAQLLAVHALPVAQYMYEIHHGTARIQHDGQ